MQHDFAADKLNDIHYLREHFERWQSAFELAPVGITIADKDGKIIAANPAAERILRLPHEQHVSKSIADSDWHILDEHGQLLSPEDYASSRALREQRVIEQQVMQVLTAGQVSWLTVSAAPLPGGGVIIVYSDITELKEHQQRVEYLLEHDQLTGIANRVAFFKVLELTIKRAHRQRGEVAVVLLDIDSFKEINEAAGHEVGDAILQEVAHRVRTHAPEHSFVARIGGDEFAVVCIPEEENLATRASLYLEQVAEPIHVNGAEFRVEVKAGLACLGGHEAQSEVLWRQADLAMHEAKTRKLSLVFYHDELAERSLRRFEVTERFRRALADQSLQIVLQPQFTIDGAFSGAEVLTRWHDDVLGRVSPCEFIPLAEERGLICRLTEQVVEQTLRLMKALEKQQLLGQQTFAINLSIRDLERDDLPQWLTTTIRQAGFASSQFELEVTETALMVNPDRAFVTLRELQELGFTIAIDDFGTGHSSLNYLKMMEAERLKIDMSFTRGMLDDRADHGIVKTIIAMASIFGMKTLAEGVECEAQATELKRLGCDYVQGFLYAEPMSVAEFTHFLQTQAQPSTK